MNDQRVRTSPSVSVESLGQYLVSPPLRRRSIIEREKYPSSFTNNYYDPARDAIESFLVGCFDRMDLICSMERLVEGPHETTYAQQRAYDCALAVLRFLEMPSPLPAMTVTRAIVSRIDVVGVDVRVAPDAILGGPAQGEVATVGAVKLLFSKTPIGSTSPEVVAAATRSLASTLGGKVYENACIAIDVFEGNVISAADVRRRTWRDVEAACEEIRRSWSTV